MHHIINYHFQTVPCKPFTFHCYNGKRGFHYISISRNNQRSQRDDSRIQKKNETKRMISRANCNTMFVFSNRRQSDLTKCSLMISQREIMIS